MELIDGLNNFFIQGTNVLNAGGFGFVCDGKFEQKTVGREFTLSALLNQIIIKTGVVGLTGEGNNGVLGLEALDKNVAILVTAFGAADNLCDQLEATLFG